MENDDSPFSEIFRIGNDMDSEYFGNGTINKIAKSNNLTCNDIYLKYLTSKY